MKDIIIVGAGGFGREVAWLIERINQNKPEWNLLGFIDDDLSKIGLSVIDGHTVLGNVDFLTDYKQPISVVCSIAAPSVRKRIIQYCKTNPNTSFPTLIAPSVITGKNINVGEGCIICANTIVTIDVQIGSFCIINLACTIGHDAVLQDYVTVYPTVNISGHVCIGESTEIGTGTQIIQGISVGNNTVVGAGSVVVKDLPDRCTAVGVPAKPIKFH